MLFLQQSHSNTQRNSVPIFSFRTQYFKIIQVSPFLAVESNLGLADTCVGGGRPQGKPEDYVAGGPSFPLIVSLVFP